MISSNIRYLRNQEGLSQEAFAERFGVSRQSVAKWENGDSTPDIVKCREIADHYEISIDSLISLPLSEELRGGAGRALEAKRGQVYLRHD